MASKDKQYIRAAGLSGLSALADGSLDPSQRAAVKAWISGSPELQVLYERELMAVAVLQEAAVERAPARLRARLEAQHADRAWRPRRRAGYGALVGALAAALAVVLALPGGTPGSPSVTEAAMLALRGASAPAPSPDRGDPGPKLAQRLEGLYFPNWSTTLGWRAVGMRRDRLGTRPAVTVYYERQGRRVAYTIVGSPALAQPAALVMRLDEFELRSLEIGRRIVVTWRRGEHTCVLSSSRVSASTLERLADWPTSGPGR